jgi:hypothetical protein
LLGKTLERVGVSQVGVRVEVFFESVVQCADDEHTPAENHDAVRANVGEVVDPEHKGVEVFLAENLERRMG